MNASKLLEDCEKSIGWSLHSFTGDFGHYRKIIKDNLEGKEIEVKEIDKFIEICNNRIERAKTFLSDVATVLGFGITGASVIVSFTDVLSPTQKDVSFFLISLFVVLVTGIIIGFLLLVHYRTHIHIWTAFKEAAILNEKYSPKGL